MSRIANINPVSITANRLTHELIVEWDDQHHSQYPFRLLRTACPCASCRGGHENMSPDPDPKVFDHLLADSQATDLNKLELVGSYGVTIEWKDGHRFGIYNWRYLRLLCPCPICRKENGEQDE
jgi:DUF971 family protein